MTQYDFVSRMNIFRITRQLFILFFVIINFNTSAQYTQNWDTKILDKLNDSIPLRSDKFHKSISNSVLPTIIFAPTGLFAYGLIKPDDNYRNDGLYVASSLLTNALLSTSLKFIVNRPRPFKSHVSIYQKDDHVGPYSFPSAHTSFAFATATSLSIAYPEWYVIAPSFAWAATVAYSRMHLGVHYPSDTLGGIVIGVGTSVLSWVIYNQLK